MCPFFVVKGSIFALNSFENLLPPPLSKRLASTYHIIPFLGSLQGDEVVQYFAISVRTAYRLIDVGELRSTKIRGCLKIPIWKIQRYEKKLQEEVVEW